MLVELPYIFVQAVLYGVIVYTCVGFEWTVAKFLWFFFFMFFTFLYYTYYGMMCVSLTPNLPLAAITSSAFYGSWMLFSGFLIPKTVSKLWILTPSFLKLYKFIGADFHIFTPEHPNLLEVVLLGMPSCMDTQWVGDISIWRLNSHYADFYRTNGAIEGFFTSFIWFPPWRAPFCSLCCCRLRSSICFSVRYRHQDPQFPEKMRHTSISHSNQVYGDYDLVYVQSTVLQ